MVRLEGDSYDLVYGVKKKNCIRLVKEIYLTI